MSLLAILIYLQADITIGGATDENPNEVKWVIPKGTIFTGALHEMMRDPEYFEKPTEFLPER